MAEDTDQVLHRIDGVSRSGQAFVALESLGSELWFTVGYPDDLKHTITIPIPSEKTRLLADGLESISKILRMNDEE